MQQILSNITLANVSAGGFANGINIAGTADQATRLLKAGAITINNIAAGGAAVDFTNVAMGDNAIAAVTINGNQANGIVLSGSDFNVTNDTVISGSTVTSFSATDMANKTTNFGKLTITQAGGATAADAFLQDGGTINLNGTTDISGQNTYGMQLVGTNLTATGEVTISDSTVSSFSATGMADKLTSFGGLNITVGGDGSANAFIQDGGSLSISGATNLSVVDGSTANTAFNVTDASSITLDDVNIGVDGNGNAIGGTFNNGIITTGTDENTPIALSGAGVITINNIAAGGTAVDFTNVAMGDNAIAAVTINGNQANGIVLSGSDFNVTNDTVISGSTVTSL